MGKGDIYKVLRNVIYTEQVNHKGTLHPGEHPAIIDAAVFQKVNERLAENGATGAKEIRNKYATLPRGLLHCDACGTAMYHTYTAKGGRRYRYYACANTQQCGWDACPSKSLSAQTDQGLGGTRARAGVESAGRGRDGAPSAGAERGGCCCTSRRASGFVDTYGTSPQPSRITAATVLHGLMRERRATAARVTDATGAFIPKAKVTATNQASV
jgi:hypothetical protein